MNSYNFFFLTDQSQALRTEKKKNTANRRKKKGEKSTINRLMTKKKHIKIDS